MHPAAHVTYVTERDNMLQNASVRDYYAHIFFFLHFLFLFFMVEGGASEYFQGITF